MTRHLASITESASARESQSPRSPSKPEAPLVNARRVVPRTNYPMHWYIPILHMNRCLRLHLSVHEIQLLLYVQHHARPVRLLTMMIFLPILAKVFPRLASSRPFTLAIFAARRPIITTPPPPLVPTPNQPKHREAQKKDEGCGGIRQIDGCAGACTFSSMACIFLRLSSTGSPSGLLPDKVNNCCCAWCGPPRHSRQFFSL